MNRKNAATDELRPDEDAPDAVPPDGVEHEPNAATKKLHELLDEVHADPAAEPHYQDASRRLALLAVMPKIRGRRKLSQTAVAAAMGTTQSAVSELESGKVDPQLRTLQRYARAIKRRLDFGLVDEELPTFDEGTANGLWRLVERNSLSPLLTALAIETEKDKRRHLSEIADFVNLPPTVVRPMLASLCRMGWVTNSGYGDDQFYSLVSDAAYVIGVSIHHDRVAGALIDLSTKVVPATYIAMPLPDPTRGTVIQTTLSVVTRLYHATQGHQVLGVGVSIAGVVSTQQLGLVHFAPDLAGPADAWCGVPLESSLEEEIQRTIDPHLRVVVENDANALAMREYLQNGDQSLVAVLLTGAGIGMGSVIGGNVIRGANSGAGEGGHTVLDPHGPACRVAFDNHRGCLETLASAKGIIDTLGIDVPSGRIEEGLAIANDRVNHLDPAAMNAFKDAADALGRFVSILIAVLDPSRIVFYAHRELAQERPGWPSGVLFRDTVEQALRTGLPKDGRFAQAQVDWRVLDEHVIAAAAGAAAMREFLQRPVDWRPSVLPIRTVGTSVF